MLRWKSSLKPAAAVVSTDITLEDSAVTTATSFASPTNIDVNIPAVSTDDILILFSTTNDFSEPTDSPPSGWTKIVEKDGDQSGHSTVAAYWKRASSSSVATTETWSSFFPNGEYYYIWVGAYSGCATSGSPVDAYGTASFGFSSSWSVDVTTTVSDTMIVTISGSTHNSVTQTWADGTELIDTTYASEAAVSINEKLEATSGAKTRSSTASTNTSASMIAVALKPPPASTAPSLTDDAYTRNGSYADTNYGNETTLVVKDVGTSGFKRESYFTFGNIPTSTVATATFRCYLDSLSANTTHLIYDLANDAIIDEDTITFNNAPSQNNQIDSVSITTSDVGSYIEFDITSYVNEQIGLANTELSFVLRETTNGNTSATYSSKEGANSPQLVLAIPDFEEDFEGTGTPTSWSKTIVGSGTVDYDDTTDPGTGSKSLEVITSGGDSYAEVDLGSVYANFKLIFQNKIASGGSNRKWIVGSASAAFASNEKFVLGFVSGWDYGWQHNSANLLRTTTGVSLGSWHWVKLEVDYANTTVTLTISASSDFSSPDVASSASASFNAGFSGLRYLRFGGMSRDMSVWVDEFSAYNLDAETYTVISQLDSTQDNGNSFSNNIPQKFDNADACFSTGSDHSSAITVAKVDVQLKRTGTPTGELTCYLYEPATPTSEGVPDDRVGTADAVLSMSSISSSGFETYSFTFTGQSELAAGRWLYVVLYASDSTGVDASNYIEWAGDNFVAGSWSMQERTSGAPAATNDASSWTNLIDGNGAFYVKVHE